MPVQAGRQSVFQTVEYIKCLRYSTNLLIYYQDKLIQFAEEEGEDTDNVYCNEEQ